MTQQVGVLGLVYKYRSTEHCSSCGCRNQLLFCLISKDDKEVQRNICTQCATNQELIIGEHNTFYKENHIVLEKLARAYIACLTTHNGDGLYQQGVPFGSLANVNRLYEDNGVCVVTNRDDIEIIVRDQKGNPKKITVDSTQVGYVLDYIQKRLYYVQWQMHHMVHSNMKTCVLYNPYTLNNLKQSSKGEGYYVFSETFGKIKYNFAFYPEQGVLKEV